MMNWRIGMSRTRKNQMDLLAVVVSVLAAWQFSTVASKGADRVGPTTSKVFIMSDGVALWEAESADVGTPELDWWKLSTEVPGFTGSGFLHFGKSGLNRKSWLDPIEQSAYPYPAAVFTYYVFVPHAGEYEVRLRNRHVQKDGDNDAWVAVNQSRFIKVWDHHTEEWGWDDRAQTYLFREGVNRVVLAGRSGGFMVDRLAVVEPGTPSRPWAEKHLPTSAVHGSNSVFPHDSKANQSKSEFLPRQVWTETEGYVVIEAENLDHHENWSLLTKPAGFSGAGYLKWIGPKAPGSGNDDYTGARHHPQNTHLIVQVLISNPGVYRMDVRNIHQHEDGDNDAWIGELGRSPESDWPIKRIGDSHRDGKEFTWADWGTREFLLKRGLNTLYLGGRSPGFGIDRIVLWHLDMKGAEAEAHLLSTKQSQFDFDVHAGPALLESNSTLIDSTEFAQEIDGFQNFGGDGSMIGMKPGRTDKGAVSVKFPGLDGHYNIRCLVLSEKEGSAEYRITVGDKSVLNFQGRETSSPAFVSEPSDVLWFRKNEPIRVEIESSDTAQGRFRALILNRSNIELE